MYFIPFYAIRVIKLLHFFIYIRYTFSLTKTSMVIVDSKSVKNTDLPEEKGYDAGKKLPA